MKKFPITAFIFGLALLLAVPLFAKTDPDTARFLRQMAPRFYSLQREGLKNLQCQVTLTLPEGCRERLRDTLKRQNITQVDAVLEALDGLRYMVKLEGHAVDINLQNPPSVGDEQADQAVVNEGMGFGKLVQSVVQIWAGMTYDPFVEEKDLVEKTFKVQRTDQGFDILESAPDGTTGTMNFDSGGNATHMSGDNGKGQQIDMSPHYVYTQKGYLQDGCSFQAGPIRYKGTIAYSVTGGYYLPSKWDFDFLIPGALAEEDQFTLAFSDYQINLASSDRPDIQVTGQEAQPTYHFDLPTARIEKVNKQWVASRNQNEPGLTEMYYSWSTDSNIESTPPREGELQIWCNTVTADFSIKKFDVYISSQYPKGSCPYQVILDHENTHVAINQDTYRKYRKILEETLRNDPNIPTQSHPWKAKTFKKGCYMVKNYLAGVVGEVVRKFWAEEGLANAQIDLPSSYRATQAKCKDW